MDWRFAANCRDEDPRLFFPKDDDSYLSRLQIKRAKTLCGRCGVIEECLKAALEKNEAGIWGGTTKRERTGQKDPWHPWEERWEQEPSKLTRVHRPTDAMLEDVAYTISSPVSSSALGLIEEGFPW